MSIINFGRIESLDTIRQSPTSKFTDMAIEVTTQSNPGTVSFYTNKCCFISIYDGLQKLGICMIGGLEISPLILMLIADFLEFNTMIDTDNPKHKECLEYLVGLLPTVKLHFFIGKLLNDKWTTTPDPSVIIGNGYQIIRILNKGYHFEFITTPAEHFVRNPTKTHDFYIRQQEKEEERIRMYLRDREIARNIEESDRLYALTFLTDSNIATQI